MRKKTNEKGISIKEDELYKKVTKEIKLGAILSKVYCLKMSEEMLNSKVKNQLNAINYSINQINPKFVDKSKKYEKISNEILETINNYENNIKQLCNYYDNKIEQLLFDKIELENRIIIDKTFQKIQEEPKTNLKKKIVQKVNSTIDKIKGKIKKSDSIDVGMINKIKDGQDIAREMNVTRDVDNDLIDLNNKLNEINKKIQNLNQEKEKNVMNCMESQERGLSIEIKRPKTIKRITSFFYNKFNTYNVIMKNIIEPINNRIEQFKEEKLNNQAINDNEFKMLEFENKIREIEKRVLLDEINVNIIKNENVV